MPKPANCNVTFQPSTAQQKELRQGFDSWYEQEISFFHDQPFYPAYRDVFQAGATIADLQYIDFLSRASLLGTAYAKKFRINQRKKVEARSLHFTAESARNHRIRRDSGVKCGCG